jgi:hypothetical protein
LAWTPLQRRQVRHTLPGEEEGLPPRRKGQPIPTLAEKNAYQHLGVPQARI